MKRLIAIWLGKLLTVAGKIMGKKSSSGPGAIALKLCPTIVDDINKIVIGYPRNLNGTIGPRAEKTEEFIKILIDKFNLDVIKWNEWLSTVSAHRDMNDMNIKKKKKRGIVDTIAAVHILQNYLDAQRNKINIF